MENADSGKNQSRAIPTHTTFAKTRIGTYGRGDRDSRILNLDTRRERSASRPGRFSPTSEGKDPPVQFQQVASDSARMISACILNTLPASARS
jgi:hypothetical protein